jgi:hypothetical protein
LRIKYPTFSFALLAAFASALWAQTFTGDIVGRVTDQAGGIMPGVGVTLTNLEINQSWTVVSNQHGEYLFSRLSPGKYAVEAEQPGFRRFRATDVQLLVGTRRRVDIELRIGEIVDRVEVADRLAAVQPDDVVLGQVFREDVIRALPLNGRNFVELAQLSPGVVSIGSAQSPGTTWTGRADSAVVVAGMRETDVSYLLDGIETRSPRWGHAGLRPSIDATREFNVQRNAFTADQGWGTTVVNTVVKSGSNHFHGTLYHFLRNDALDARNFFDRGDKPPFKQNQFGFSVGGPVLRDRIFFFVNYEGFRQRLGTTLQGRVPEPEALQGRIAPVDPVSGRPVTVIDPTTGEPFPGNVVPPDRMDAVIQRVLPLFPAPNRPEDPQLNFVRSPTRVQDTNQTHVKVDLVLGERDRAFVRYSWLDDDLTQPGLFEGFGLLRPLGNRNVAASYTRVFNANTVNELRIGYNRDRTFNLTEGALGPDVAREIGLANTSTNPLNRGLPSFRIQAFSRFGSNATQTQAAIDNLFQISNNLTIRRGRHTFKMGFDVRPDRLQINHDFPSSPIFTFNGLATGSPIADFLLGYFDIAENFIGDSTSNLRANNFSFYFMDDWKVHSRVSLSLGLRYEFFQPFTEENDKMNYLDFRSQQFVSVEGRLFPPDRNNFAPRVGIAYSPTSKTVVRSGFGVFYDLVAANETQFLGNLNPPVSQIVSLVNPAGRPVDLVQEMFPDPSFTPTFRPIVVDLSDRTPYVYQYNLNLQRETLGLLVEAGYVGSTGHKLNRRANLNLAVPAPGVPLAQRRPFDRFPDIIASLNNGWSNYNGFNLSIQRRMSTGPNFLLSYTLGKALDIGGPDEHVERDLTGVIPDLRGPAQIDSRHRLVLSYTYELPFGRGGRFLGGARGVLGTLVSGWEMNGIGAFVSGQARTPRAGFDLAQIGIRRFQPPIRLGDGNDSNLRADIRNQPTLFPFFRVDDFASPEPGTLGDAGRGILRGPGANNWDMGFIKNNRLTENVSLQFRAEFFNIFNHTQFLEVDTVFTSPTFGRITSARAPRSIQFGLKVLF